MSHGQSSTSETSSTVSETLKTLPEHPFMSEVTNKEATSGGPAIQFPDTTHSEAALVDQSTNGTWKDKARKCFNLSPQARAWIWDALVVRLPVTIVVLGLLFTIGIICLYLANPREYKFNASDLGIDRVRFSPMDFVMNGTDDEVASRKTDDMQPRLELRPYHKDFPSDFNILLETHLHTRYSDGVLTIEQALLWALSMGYNAIVITDHNTVEGISEGQRLVNQDPRFQNRLLIIPGMEYSCCRIHMNLIGARFPLRPEDFQTLSPSEKEAAAYLLETALVNPVPSDEDLQRVINATHALGGVVSVNHIPWSTNSAPLWMRRQPTLPHHPSREQLLKWGVDYLEVVGASGTFDLVSAQFVERHAPSIGMLVGRDMHYPSPTSSWTILKTSNYSVKAIMTELRAKRTSFLFDAAGIPAALIAELNVEGTRNPSYDNIQPLVALGSYLGIFYDYQLAMTSFQGPLCASSGIRIHGQAIGMFLLISLLLFFGFELLFYFLRCYMLPFSKKMLHRIHHRVYPQPQQVPTHIAAA